MLKANMMIRVALAVAAVGLLVTPVAATVYSCSQSLTVCGIDLSGHLSFSLGSKCTTKSYCDSSTRICTSVSSCKVWNKCGRSCSFRNQGCSIKDAITGILHTCTSDLQSCSKPNFWDTRLKCWAPSNCTLTCCYNPCASTSN
jgi:hypothetical protein